MAEPTVQLFNRANETMIRDLRTVDGNGVLRAPREASATEELNEDGDLTCTVDLDHPAASAFAPYRVLRLVDQEGEPKAAGYITSIREQLVLQGDHGAQQITLNCSGLMGLLGEAVTLPWVGTDRYPFSQHRVFNYASPGCPWPGEYEPYAQSRNYAVAQGLDYPTGWAGTEAEWLWCLPNSAEQPPGRAPFRRSVTTGETHQLVPIVSADNDFHLWIDGVSIGLSPVNYPGYTWWDAYKYPIELPPGVHNIVILGENWSTVGSANPAGIIFSLWTTDGEKLVTQLAASGRSGSSLHGEWTTLNYPDPMPGFTAGQIIGHLYLEALSRGALNNWTVSFTATHDSAGNPWPTIPEFVCQVRDPFRLVLSKLAESWIDIAVDTEGLTLHAWDKDQGGRTGNSGLVLTPGQNAAILARVRSV